MEKRGHGDILIVDDKPENLRLLSQMLSEQGYTVRAVTNGLRALESARVLLPDLILLDIRMPEMSGYQICEQLKADETTRDVPVIFISALSEIQDKVQAFKVGGVDYITKPFQLEEVLIRTETHLRLRQLQHRLQVANQKMKHELEMAVRMQDNFLPHDLPKVTDWEIVSTLNPARETSGDFYDVFALPDERYGILIADVVDKGVAAALFMVLGWSLMRTYVRTYPNSPGEVLSAVNRRILEDTDAQQYMTVFYGILNPGSGELVYSNAGHVPPLLINETDFEMKKLLCTGIPLGIYEDQTWTCDSVVIPPGEFLILYTDGVPDAQDPHGSFFGEQRLINAIRKRLRDPAHQLQAGVMAEIMEFMDTASQYDDITMITLRREA